MDYNEFLNNSSAIDDALICGKILLHKTEWELSFVCDFCHRKLSTLAALLAHVFREHIDDVPSGKLQDLCGIATIKEDNAEFKDQLIEKTEVRQIQLQEQIANDPEDSKSPAFGKYLTTTLEGKVELPKQAKSVQRNVNNINKDNDNAITSISLHIKNRIIDKQPTRFEFLDVERKQTQNISNVETIKSKNSKSTLICSVCGVRLPSREKLSEHRKKHGDKPFICKQCGVTFALKRNFKIHCFRHLGIKPHKCNVCEKSFTATTELKSHMRSHTGERPFKCSECDRQFRTSGVMNAHKRRHNNVRPHLCPTCGKAFFDAEQLNKHLATHSTERPHQCQQCDAKFSTTNGLRQHRQLHSGVKKYNCKLCSKTFAQAAGVYSHMKSVHKNDTKS